MPKFCVPSAALNPALNKYPSGFHAGAASLTAVDADLIAFNIRAGITIFGVLGNFMYWDRWYDATISSSNVLAIVVPDHTIAKNAALGTVHKQSYLDNVADLIKRLTPTMASVKALTVIAAPDQTIAKNTPIGSELSISVDGFVEETAAAVQTDHTAEARNDTANDLNLCPMSDTVLDKIYIGCAHKFSRVWMNYGTAGAGNWTNTGYYWNGAWTLCVGEVDQTSSFQAAAGIRYIKHTPQGDWALSIIMGMNLYWMMIRTDNFVNRTTKPLGSQILVAIP